MRADTTWPRRDVVLLTLVSVSGFVVIIGCALVGNAKNGGGQLMALVDGAFVGGLITLGAASFMLVLAPFLRFRDAIFTQAVLSTLLVAVHALSIYDVSSRMAAGFEPIDRGVEIGQLAYVAAGILQVIAAVTGFVLLGSARTRRERMRR